MKVTDFMYATLGINGREVIVHYLLEFGMHLMVPYLISQHTLNIPSVLFKAFLLVLISYTRSALGIGQSIPF